MRASLDATFAVTYFSFSVRALGMIWIIAGHLFFYGPGAIENLSIVLTYAESWYLQPLFAVAMAVDSYFVIRFALPLGPPSTLTHLH